MKASCKLRALRFFSILAFQLFSIFPLAAILDINNNGISDLWEKQQNNGTLFSTSFVPTADPDQDGWDNATEAVAGTNPFEPNPPDGIVVTQLEPSQTEGAYTLTWPTIIGKRYRLQASYDLDAWFSVGNSHFATESSLSIGISAVQPDTTVPPKIFWRIIVADVDDDGDRLTNAEEHAIRTSPFSIDTDGDLLNDWQELLQGFDPTTSDSDGDGTTDLEASLVGDEPAAAPTNPHQFKSTSRTVGYVKGEEISWIHDDNEWDDLGYEGEETHGNHTFETMLERLEQNHPFPAQPNEAWSNGAGLAHIGQANTAYTFTQTRVWAIFNEPFENDIEIPYLEVVHNNDTITETYPLISITQKEHELKAGDVISEPADILPEMAFAEGAYDRKLYVYLPLQTAPEVLKVNSDFDEGRINPETGYAIPDCDDTANVDQKTGAGNTTMELHSVRNHLEGKFLANEIVYKDLHPGWFGLSPSAFAMEDFYEDATVTIEKVDQIDSDTGYPESGHVRFYASWSGGYFGIEPYNMQTLAAKNLVTDGINGRSGEGVYGPDSPIPTNAKFFMEGVRPGKITLKWKYSKGAIEAEYVQTFQVETRKTKTQWQDQVKYQVKLQSTIQEARAKSNGMPVAAIFPLDLNKFDPANGFFKNSSNHNYAYVQRVYYYQQLFKQMPEKFYWAGMAKTAGASVYAGMADMHQWWHTPLIETINPGTKSALDIVLDEFMVQGNKDIFLDMAWSHHAYQSSGIWAIRYVKSLQEPSEEVLTDYDAWDKIYNGIEGHNQDLLAQGNRDLLRREQSVVMPPLYLKMKVVKVKPHPGQDLQDFISPPLDSDGKMNMGEAFSLNAQNPIHRSLGPRLRELVINGELADLDDRWAWIENSSKGMLQIWMGTANDAPAFDAAMRLQYNNTPLYAAAIDYSMSKELPPE
jgi:hypothetical protein